MSAHDRHLGRAVAIALAVVAVALLTAAADASAYLTAAGSTSARASVTTLPAPTIARATPGAGSVTLSWSAVSAPAAGTVTYYVTRDNGTASSACPSSTRATTATSCTDTGVANGSHTYTVTALWRSWSATSARASATVSFGTVARLVVTTQPGGTITGGSAFPTQPVVTAQDAAGATVLDYGGSVTLAIVSGTGTSGAALSGCTSTLRAGVTTFAGCKIDKSGSNYRLRASDGTLTVDSAVFNVVVGAAAQLAFTTQPGNGTGGGDLSTTPIVTAQDAGGNTVTGYSGTVTLSIASGTGTPGAALGGCDVDKLRNGVTTFNACQVDKAGSGYRLHASDNRGLATADSAAFDVTVGSVSRLVYTTQPGGGATGGTAFPTQPVVTAQDAGGNTVTTYNRSVTLSIQSGTRNAVLSGCAGTLASGVTTFAGCAIDLTGATYVLHASDGSRSVDSSSFAVSVGPAAQLAFTTSPGTSTAGTAFGSQPVVVARDAGGNTVTTYAGSVALSIGSGPVGATLSTCTGVLGRTGVTTFSGCKLDKSGSYVLHASDGAIGGDSTSFTVNAATVASIAFTTQPGGAVAATAFTTQPVLTAFDAFGNVATGYSGTITLSIKSGTGTGGTLSNCGSNRSNGVVTFSGCRISRSGTGVGYVLRASDGTRTADSAAFDVR